MDAESHVRPLPFQTGQTHDYLGLKTRKIIFSKPGFQDFGHLLIDCWSVGQPVANRGYANRPDWRKHLWSVPDLKTYLSGGWGIDRSLLDRRHAIGGKLRGRAYFSPAGSSLRYHERGTLIFGAHEGLAEQNYSFEFPDGQGCALVRFRDGRAFHDLDLSKGQAFVSHVCDPDFYEGCFIALDQRQWQSKWKVTGPRKDQEILTLYTRLP